MEGMTLEKLQVIIEAQTKAYYEELKKVQLCSPRVSAAENQSMLLITAGGIDECLRDAASCRLDFSCRSSVRDLENGT